MNKVIVLHSDVPEGAGKDEEDVLVQVEAVSRALSALGYDPVALPFTIDIKASMVRILAIRPTFVFNLVETLDGVGRLIHIAPAILDYLKIPYTGAGTEAMLSTSNKLVAKKWLKQTGIPTPRWFCPEDLRKITSVPKGAYIAKSVWEHASIGLDEDSVIFTDDPIRLLQHMESRRDKLGGDCFVEAFIEGRELNLSLLTGEGSSKNDPEALPPAEIHFDAFPEGKMRVVGYSAKWESDSFEYHHTPRSFDFPPEDDALIARLKQTAGQCWHLFGLRGYARVDYRVDTSGAPRVLEVNANPCLSPAPGLGAALERAGIAFEEAVRRIILENLRA